MSESEFALAIDIGSSHIVVATARLTQSEHAAVAPYEWGGSEQRAPAIAYLAPDDTLLFGAEAAQRAAMDPARAVNGFAQRLGDDIPLTVDGCALPAELVYASAVSWAIETVVDTEGAAPAALTLIHPAHWGEHRVATLRDALHRQGISDFTTLAGPKAAAMRLDASQPLEPGDTVAVYELGAETAECVVLRRRHDGHYDIVGDAVHIDDIGGTGFEDAVLDHVITAAALDVAALALHPEASQLRNAVRSAKEALSSNPDATIDIAAIASSVRITRAEFENMIVGDVDQSLEALAQAVDSAHLTPERLSAIVLSGGSSRIPFIAQRLSDRFGRPVVSDDAPEAGPVLGAARAALAALGAQQASEPQGDWEPDETADDARPLAGVLAGASQRPRPALKSGTFIVLAVAATLIAGAIVFEGATALGDARIDPAAGTTRVSDDRTHSDIRSAASTTNTDEAEAEATIDEPTASPAPEPEVDDARRPVESQRSTQGPLTPHQPAPSRPTAPVTMRPPIESTRTPTPASSPAPPTPADPHPADTPPSDPPTTPGADPGPAPNPNPEPAPDADPPPASDPIPTEPTPQDPAQEQSPGVDTD